jgi:hypothetical protein
MQKLIKQTGGITTGDGRNFQYELDLSKKKPTIKIKELPTRLEKPTDPEAGHEKFVVTCDKLTIYTTIGADNLHHASNKATKLFGPHWSQITQSHYIAKEYLFLTVAKFTELIKTLPN